MDALDAGCIQKWTGVLLRSELRFLSVLDVAVFEWQVMRFLGHSVIVFQQEDRNITLHGEAACACHVVPSEADAGKL